MKKLFLFVVLCAAMALSSCGEDGLETITVASRKATCYTVAKMECFVVKHQGSDQWQLWYDGVKGFEYTEGYEYVIKVRRVERAEGIQDVGRYYYEFVDQVSMLEKESEGLPWTE